MRHALLALTDELRRLKAAGVKRVAVSDETIATLKQVMAERASRQKVGDQVAPATAALEATLRATVVRPSLTVEPGAVVLPTFARAPEPGEVRATTPLPRTAPAPAKPEAAALLPPPPVIELAGGTKAERWASLLEKVMNDVTCKANVRADKKVVLGVGSLDAKIMFVGEAPGAEEEIQGEPFVGPAGQLLTKMIQAMGLQRSDVYIGNIMNWRPQMPTVDGRDQVGNRPPSPEEMRYCLPFLRAQIEVVNPDVLVALGSTAAQGLLGFGSFKALGEVRGRWHLFAEKPLMVTYHPSYILRNQSSRSKRMIWDDLLKVMERVPLPVTEKQRSYFLDK